LQVLERKGQLERGALGARSLKLSGPQHSNCPRCALVPVIGRIAAGQPIEALEDPTQTVTVTQSLTRGAELFALQVKGDSMIDAGIWDGDTVLVRKQESADDGEIVVALLDGEATLKYLYREGKRVRLQPANPALKPIYVDAKKLKIQGKVVSAQRNFDRKPVRTVT
jgi:repressor LexA